MKDRTFDLPSAPNLGVLSSLRRVYGTYTVVTPTLLPLVASIAEGKRYYDLRRWMDAPVEESIPVYGCNVYMPESQRDEFQRVVPVYSLPTRIPRFISFRSRLTLYVLEPSHEGIE